MRKYANVCVQISGRVSKRLLRNLIPLYSVPEIISSHALRYEILKPYLGGPNPGDVQMLVMLRMQPRMNAHILVQYKYALSD